MRHVVIAVVLILAVIPTASAETYKVRVVRDLDYVPGKDYADNKDRLDLYVPEGRSQFPVIVSLHGGGLVEGDKSRQSERR